MFVKRKQNVGGSINDGKEVIAYILVLYHPFKSRYLCI